MPLDLKALSIKGATVVIPVYEDELNVVYDPTKWTAKFRDDYVEKIRTAWNSEIKEGDEDAAQRRTPSFTARNKPTAEVLATMVIEWDLLDNGKPVPLKTDAISKQVPEELQQHILAEIRRDISDLGNSSRASANGSSPAGS